MDETKAEKNQTVQDKATWRELSVSDVNSVASVADYIHPDLPESDEVSAERVLLFPEGCLGFPESRGNDLCGYVISHPIRRLQPPALNSLLGEIPSDADQYYMHDLAQVSRTWLCSGVHGQALCQRQAIPHDLPHLPSTAQSNSGVVLGSRRCR